MVDTATVYQYDPAGNRIRITSRIVAYFQPLVDIPAAMAYEAELDVIGPAGVPLDNFWRFDPGGCNAGALSVRPLMFGAQGPSGCPYALAEDCPPNPPPGCLGPNPQAALFMVDYPHPVTGEINKARIRVIGSAPGHSTIPYLYAYGVYSLFGLELATNSGCVGCETPVALRLTSVRINQPEGGMFGCALPAIAERLDALRTGTTVAGRDLVIPVRSSWDSSGVYFNGVPTGYSVTGTVPSAKLNGAWLGQPHPNPSQGSLRIRYGIARGGYATLGVFDVTGRSVRTLANGTLPAGKSFAIWDGRMDDGRSASGGVYFVRLRTEDGEQTRTLIRIQ